MRLKRILSLPLIVAIMVSLLSSIPLPVAAATTKDNDLKEKFLPYRGNFLPTEQEYKDYNAGDVIGIGTTLDGKQTNMFYGNTAFATTFPLLKTAMGKSGNIEVAAAGYVTQTDTRATMLVGNAISGDSEKVKGYTYINNQFLKSTKWRALSGSSGNTLISWSYEMEDMPIIKDQWGDPYVSGEKPTWGDVYLLMRDPKEPVIESVGLTSVDKEVNNRIVNGAQVSVDVLFDEPVNPNTTDRLKFKVNGRVLADLTFVKNLENYTGARYSFTIPDDIFSASMEIDFFYEVANQGITDFFGGNLLKIDTDNEVKMTINKGISTVRPRLVKTSSETYYTTGKAWLSGNQANFILYFNERLYDDLKNLRIKGAIFETAEGGVGRTNNVLKEFEFKYSGTRSDNGYVFVYIVGTDDPEGIIDLYGASEYTAVDGIKYWDILPCMIQENGDPYDFSNVQGIESKGPTMIETAFRTDKAVAGDSAGSFGTVMENLYARGPMPNIDLIDASSKTSVIAGGEKTQREFTLYATTDKERVYSPLECKREDVLTKPDENMNKIALSFASGSTIVIKDDLGNGVLPPSLNGSCTLAANMHDTEDVVSKVKLTSLEEMEGSVALNISAIDVSGGNLSGAGLVYIDTKGPRLSFKLEKHGIWNEGQTVTISHIFTVNDMSKEGSKVYYQYVPDDGELSDIWQNTTLIEDSDTFKASREIVANEIFSGKLYYYGEDALGNKSGVESTTVYFNNSTRLSQEGVNVETSGKQQEHRVTFSQDITEDFDIAYKWTATSGNGKNPVITQYTTISETRTIGSHEDQAFWMNSSEDYFEGEYQLNIEAVNKADSSKKSYFSYTFEFDNYGPKITLGPIGTDGICLVEITNGSDLQSAGYKIVKPGEDSTQYEMGVLTVNGPIISTTISPQIALKTGYYEIVVTASEEGSSSVSEQRKTFIYDDPNDTSREISMSNVKYRNSENNVQLNNGIYYVDIVADSQITFDLSYEMEFVNYDKLPDGKTMEAYRAEDGLLGNEGHGVSFEQESSKIYGTIPVSLGINTWAGQFGKVQNHWYDIVCIYDSSDINLRSQQLSCNFVTRSVQDTTYFTEIGDTREFELIATRGMQTVKVKSYEIESIIAKNLYYYDETSGLGYNEILYIPSRNIPPQEYDDYIEFFGNEGDFTGFKVKKNSEIKIRFTSGYENDENTDAATDWSVVNATAIPLTVETPYQSLRINYEYDYEVMRNNTRDHLLKYSGGETATEYRPATDQYDDSDMYKRQIYDVGYERYAVEFYSGLYDVIDFALIGTNDTDNYGNVKDDLSSLSTVSDADKERFDDYATNGKLILEESFMPIYYVHRYTTQGGQHKDIYYHDMKTRYRIELYDMSEFKAFYLACQLKLSDSESTWVYVPYSHAPANRDVYSLVCSPYRETLSVADADKTVPQITFDDPTNKALGTLRLENAATIVDWNDVSDFLEPDTNEYYYELAFNPDEVARFEGLTAKLAQIARTKTLSEFSHNLQLPFTPDSEFNLLLTDMGGRTFAISRFNAEDYDIDFKMSDLSVTYYENYGDKTEFVGNPKIAVSLFANSEMTEKKDFAVEIKPSETETEYYYIKNIGGTNAIPSGTILEQSEIEASSLSTEIKERLTQLSTDGNTIYKDVLLKPNETVTEDPFGKVEVAVINADKGEFDLPIVFNIDASPPVVTYQIIMENDKPYILIDAEDKQAGITSFTVKTNGVLQTATATNFYRLLLDNSIDNTFEIDAVNSLGMAFKETKHYEAGSAPFPPLLNIDYRVKYQYKDQNNILRDVEEGKDYSIVFAVIDILKTGTTVKNNNGSNEYAFLPGGVSSFKFQLENGNGTSEQEVSRTMPNLDQLASVDYSPKDANVTAVTIEILALGEDLNVANVVLNDASNKTIPLSSDGTVEKDGKVYSKFTATVNRNGVYTYRITKDGILLKTASLTVDNINQDILDLKLTRSIDKPTYNNVVIGVSGNKAFTVTKTEVFEGAVSAVTQLSSNIFMFTENASLRITCKDNSDDTEKSIDAIVDYIDKEVPIVSAVPSYGDNNAYAEVSFDSTTDPLEDLILSSVVKLDEGRMAGTSQTMSSLDGAKIRITQNGVYRFSIRDKAGNTVLVDIKIDGIDDTKPSISKVSWEYDEVEKDVTPTDGYVEILTSNNDKPTNQDVKLTIETNKDVTETGYRVSDYKKVFNKVLYSNLNGSFTFEDKLGNAAALRITTDIIDKGFPVIDFPTGGELIYFEPTKDLYKKEHLEDFTVGDYKDGIYTPMEKSKVQIDYGDFKPDNIDENTFDFKNPYVITYTVEDDAGNITEATRVVRLFGKSDMCVLINGIMPTGDIVEVFNSTIDVKVENYNGEIFVSYAEGDLNTAQMKSRGTPIAHTGDGKSFSKMVTPRRWYTVMVRTGTLEMFTVKIWVN